MGLEEEEEAPSAPLVSGSSGMGDLSSSLCSLRVRLYPALPLLLLHSLPRDVVVGVVVVTHFASH